MLSQEYSLMYLFSLLRKYFWYIVMLVGLATSLAVVLTMPRFYPPEYKSSTIVYPTNPERYDLDNLYIPQRQLYVYGDAKTLERLVNIAGSEDLIMAVMDSLDLWKSYGIDKQNGASPKYYGFLEYADHVSILQVDGGGIEISAFDRDPEKAAKIVNLVAYKIDELYGRLTRKNAEAALSLFIRTEADLAKRVAIYADSLRLLRKKYHIYDVERQTQALLAQLMQAEAGQIQAKSRLAARPQDPGYVQSLKEEIAANEALRNRIIQGAYVNLSLFQDGLDRVRQNIMLHEQLTGELKQIRERIANLTIMTAGNFQSLLQLEAAQPSDKKARPARGLIVIATFLLSLLTCLMGLLLIERIGYWYNASRHAA